MTSGRRAAFALRRRSLVVVGTFDDVLVLDGGLATTLEEAGADLSDELWSARLLLDDPSAIVEVHRAFLDAGADVIITASYQASVGASCDAACRRPTPRRRSEAR
jgi:homocysteine S-methyltransferase